MNNMSDLQSGSQSLTGDILEIINSIDGYCTVRKVFDVIYNPR